MSLRPLLLAFVFVLQAIPGSAAPAAQDGQHDFDFQFGTWNVHVERLLHPLSGSTTWVHYDGTHVVSKVWGGRANLGVLEIAGPSGRIEGQSLRLYDPQTRRWSFTFAQSGNGTMGPPMTGSFRDGRGEFFNHDIYDGRAVLVRNITSDITPTSYRDEYAYSTDGGTSWETNWIATFTRANGRSPSAPAFAGSNPQQHAFDFEWGTWRAHLRRLLHPLTGSHAWVTYDGPSVVRKVWNGRANLGEIDLTGSAGRIVGLSLRLYDPQTRQWSISFASLGDGVLGTPPTIGSFRNGRGEFYDHETLANGRAIYDRFVFSNISSKHFHFEQSFSDDGGKTWEVNWIADFTKPASSSTESVLRDGSHDFDFNIGRWTSRIRRLLHPLSGSTTWVEYKGAVVVRPVWGGRANLEEVEATGTAGHLEFVELRLYNPASHQWSINSAATADGSIQGPPLIGDFDSGRGLFYDQEFYDGRAIFVRQIWTVNSPASYSMVQSFSSDGGKSWETNFVADVTRAN